MEQLLAILASLANVPEAFHKFYKKGDDGKFYLQVTGVDGWALENVQGLKTNLSTALEEKRQAVAKLAKIPEGFDIDKAQQAMTKVEEMKNWKPEDKVREQMKAREDELTAKHRTELEKVANENKDLVGQIESVLADGAIATALTKFELMEGGATLLTPHIRAQIKVAKNDQGKYAAQVMNADGKTPRMTQKSNDTSNMGIEELVSIMSKDKTFASCFKAKPASGPGKPGSRQPQPSGGLRQQENVNPDGPGDPNLSPTVRLQQFRRSQQGQSA